MSLVPSAAEQQASAPRQGATLAIDFGTSNSAAAVLAAGRVFRIPIETGADTLPTAVFFPQNGGEMRIGEAAIRALTSGDEGRFMRALKSVLGTELLHEERLIGKSRRSLAQIITQFLALVKARAEAMTGMTFTHALSGRPVKFHSRDAVANARAEEDLRACYLAAGFEDVRFCYEPEAAALATRAAARDGEKALIVDIGGGTSDFSAVRSTGGKVEILASHGIRLGGTDFDRNISLAHVMPLLGHGSEMKREFGPGRLPMPPEIFVDLARWETIPFLYNPDTRREARELAKLAVEPEKLARLEVVLRDELGHDLAFASERGKIAANRAEGPSRVALGLIEKGLTAEITPASLAEALDDFGTRLSEAAAETLASAGLESVDVVVLVGGSSLMLLVSDAMQKLLPNARIDRSEPFTAVVDGLALASAEG